MRAVVATVVALGVLVAVVVAVAVAVAVVVVVATTHSLTHSLCSGSQLALFEAGARGWRPLVRVVVAKVFALRATPLLPAPRIPLLNWSNALHIAIELCAHGLQSLSHWLRAQSVGEIETETRTQ